MRERVKAPNISAKEIGERLKRARLNSDLTQAEVAKHANISRKSVVNAEKGNVKLENLVAIMMVLNLSDHLDQLIPKQEISPIQLSKLEGRKRQRASGTKDLDKQGRSDW